MGLVKGLKNINARVDAEEARFAGKDDGDSVKAKWFKISDGQTVKVRFLQELDVDSPNFSPKNDIGFLAVEHSNPKNFRKKALCTIDEEGECWACQQHSKDWKAGWKQKSRLYINVLVDDGKEEPYVAILSQGNGPKSITPVLLEFAVGEEDEETGEVTPGSITDKWYKIKRKGAGLSDTSYMLMPSTAAKGSVEDYELFDLEKAVYSVPYAQQEAHYLDGEEPTGGADEPVEELVGASSGVGESDW